MQNQKRTTINKDNSSNGDNDNHNYTKAMHLPWPVIRQKEAIIKVFNLSNEAQRLVYTIQTSTFPKKLSRGYQYIMVLIKIDSNTILVEAMKNRTAEQGKCSGHIRCS